MIEIPKVADPRCRAMGSWSEGGDQIVGRQLGPLVVLNSDKLPCLQGLGIPKFLMSTRLKP